MESMPYQLSDIDKLLRELYQLKKMNQMLVNQIKRLKEEQFYDESIQSPRSPQQLPSQSFS
jgi:cell division protein FtsB